MGVDEREQTSAKAREDKKARERSQGKRRMKCKSEAALDWMSQLLLEEFAIHLRIHHGLPGRTVPHYFGQSG